MEQERGGRGDTESEPAVSRRALLAAVAGVAGLAGCSGGGDDGSDDGGGTNGDDGSDDGGSNGDDSGNGGPSIESMCNVSDDVDGLTVVGCQSETDEGDLVATATIRNDGDEVTDLFNYRLESRAYDASEAAIENNVTGSVTITYEGIPEIQPGEATGVTITISPNPDVGVDAIEIYTVKLSCGFGANGVYCEES